MSILTAPHFHNEEAAQAFVEASIWSNGPMCPNCGAAEEHIGELKGHGAAQKNKVLSLVGRASARARSMIVDNLKVAASG